MIFKETAVQGAFIIELNELQDERGFFARAFCADEFAAHGLETAFVQANISQSNHKHTVRGMHMQTKPHGETKLMRCTRGAVYDALIDLRPDSPTFHKWVGVELTADNHKMLYVPAGCAHGYQTLSDDAEVFYPVTAPYNADSEIGIRWDDPFFGIDWPEKTNAIVSDKDKAWPLYETA